MRKPFTAVTVALLSLIAVVQLVRLIMGWQVNVEGVGIPLWVSAVAAVVTAGLAALVWKEMR